MWYDNWSQLGHLIYHLTHRNLYESRLLDNLTVSDMVCNRKWKWSMGWNEMFLDITNLPNPILDPIKSDKLMWKLQSGSEIPFTIKHISKDLRDKEPVVCWSKLVWFSQCIPKHSFILWVTFLGRLSTQDKLGV